MRAKMIHNKDKVFKKIELKTNEIEYDVDVVPIHSIYENSEFDETEEDLEADEGDDWEDSENSSDSNNKEQVPS